MEMMYIVLLVSVVFIAVSYFKLYRLSHVTVAYEDSIGQVRGYKFDYADHWKERWLDIGLFERYVADKKKMPAVKITGIMVKSEWKIRRS